MKFRTCVVIGSALSGTLLLAAWDLLRGPTREVVGAPPPSRTSAPASRPPELAAAVAVLEAENAVLRERLDGIESRLRDASRRADPLPPARPPAAHEELDAPAPEPRHEVPPEERIAFLEQVYQRDGSDVPRSLELEASLRSGLAESELPADALASSECGGSLCRAEFLFASHEERDLALRRIPDLVPWESDGYASVDPADPTRLIVFLTQEDGVFPLP